MERGAAQNKLRRRGGATLALAMAILLIASMFSMVMITASVNAVKAAWGQYGTEQSYLCVSAAARMLNQEILRPAGTGDASPDAGTGDASRAAGDATRAAGDASRAAGDASRAAGTEGAVLRYTAEVTRDGVETDDWPTLSGPMAFLESYGFENEKLDPRYLPAQTKELTIRELLSFMFEQCDTKAGWMEPEGGPSHSLTITLPLDGTKGRMVDVKLTMYAPNGTREPYSLTAILSAGDGTGADEGKSYPDYTMQLEYSCTVRETEAERHETHYEEEEDGTMVPDYWETAKVTTTTLDWTLKKVGRGN